MQTPEEYFTRDMWAAATALAKQLKAPMPPDFEAALLPLADTRRAIAARNGNENFERFGRKRTSDEYKTGHSIIYDESLDLGRRFAVEAREWPLRFSMRIGGQDIRLTYIAQKRGEDGFDWFHLKTRDVPPLMDRARRLYNMTLDKTLTRSQVIALVAELHWYLAQAMPYDRGSAAITDALTKAIFLSHDISVGQWKLHITPDIVAFMVTPEKFVSIYPELFE